ncbi:pyridoxamine 5'-phosphate oxidase family protein [Sporichthya polymorpha]|uniref:pyridoxamine 5'-phosphate oxidase family protein n=1 Tax=Sporichthya polymorpha TaxID=35751 RepID=UPI00036EE36B|nr:pyridoxamine 5'-phosphate oxidase family protein [Sporichthya polymorpha]
MSLPGSVVRHLDPLDEKTAMTLLAREQVGRLAFCMHGGPHIEVVNFVVVDGDVIFRIGVSAKLAALGRGGVFALQCDRINTGTRTGWTVTVQGPARTLSAEEVAALPIQPDPWAPGERPRVVCLTPRHIFGRVLSADE